MSNFTPKSKQLESDLEKKDSSIQRVANWLDEVVIKQNFCPYAKAPRANGHIRFCATETTSTQAVLELVAQELKTLDRNPEIETTLIIIENYLQDFFDYLDVLDIAQGCLSKWGYEGVYQLASFHPHYIFEGESLHSASHYTNRSPYPLFHIIREKSIEEVIKRDDQGDKIAQRNIIHANQLGVDFFKRYL